MSSNADTAVEPQLEEAGAGPKLAETETKLATEPIHGDKAAESEEGQAAEKADASSAAPVRDIYTWRISEHAVWDFQLTGL
jgi:hypothetical protein